VDFIRVLARAEPGADLGSGGAFGGEVTGESCRGFGGLAEQGAEVFADVEGSEHLEVVGEAGVLRWYRWVYSRHARFICWGKAGSCMRLVQDIRIETEDQMCVLYMSCLTCPDVGSRITACFDKHFNGAGLCEKSRKTSLYQRRTGSRDPQQGNASYACDADNV
jgi:hypothetical protein